jgi:hypothetical protein
LKKTESTWENPDPKRRISRKTTVKYPDLGVDFFFLFRGILPSFIVITHAAAASSHARPHSPNFGSLASLLLGALKPYGRLLFQSEAGRGLTVRRAREGELIKNE